MPNIQLQSQVGTWSAGGDMNTARQTSTLSGSNSSAIVVGGNPGTNTTELYNGSAWTASTNITVTSRWGHIGLGSATSNLIAGGYNGGALNTTERLVGTTWTASTNMPYSLYQFAAFGSPTNACTAGGYSTSYNSVIQICRGTTWTSSYYLNTSRAYHAAFGNENVGIIVGGTSNGSDRLSSTERFNGFICSAVSGGNLSIPRYQHCAFGSPNAGVVTNGYGSSSAISSTERFNGFTWYAGTATTANRYGVAATGSAGSDGLICGGYNGTTSTYVKTTERYLSFDDPSLSVLEGSTAGTVITTLSASEPSMVFSLVAGAGDTDNSSFSISGSNLTALSNFNYEGKTSYSLRINATNGTTTYQNILTVNVTDDPELGILTLRSPQGAWATASGWLNSTGRYQRPTCVGSVNSAFLVGGSYSATSESYNGSVWTSGPSASYYKYESAAAGTQNASVFFGGNQGNTTASLNITELFNGSSFSTGNNCDARHFHSGLGVQNSAVLISGHYFQSGTAYQSSYCSLFNGSTWSASGAGALTSVSGGGAASGSKNAGIYTGGDISYASSTAGLSAITNKFNGYTWSGVQPQSVAKRNIAGPGSSSGYFQHTNGGTSSASTYLTVSEKFNGVSTWFTVASLNTGKYGHVGVGTYESSLSIGGTASNGYSISAAERYASFSDNQSLSVVEGTLANTTIATLAAVESSMVFSLAAGPGDTDNSSFSISGTDLKTANNVDYEAKTSYSLRINATNGTTTYQNILTVNATDVQGDIQTLILRTPYESLSVLSASLNTVRRGCGGAGTSLAALAISGYNGSAYQSTTELFNGSTWASSASTLSSRDYVSCSAVGSASAAMFTSGENSSSVFASTEKYNGTSWSSSGSLLNARTRTMCVGSQNAATAAGGSSAIGATSVVNYTEKFNGTTWTTSTALSAARSYGGASGGQNTVFVHGGYLVSSTVTATSENFNGTTWSAGASLLAARYGQISYGTQTSASTFCGFTSGYNPGSGYTYSSEKFNGNSWSVGLDANVPRTDLTRSADSTVDSGGILYGGYNVMYSGVYYGTTERISITTPAYIVPITEPIAANTKISNIWAPEPSMVFSLVAGAGDTDNSSFSISGTDLNVLEAVNYETKSSYSLRIRATNGTVTNDFVTTVPVSNAAEAPIDIVLSSDSIIENNSVNQQIGVLTASDPDLNEVMTFSLVQGSDKFNIVLISGQWRLRASVVLDYEDATSHQIVVRATDSTNLTYDKTFTIYVLNQTTDDPVALDPVANNVVVLSSGAILATISGDPRVSVVSYNGTVLPVGSVIKNSQNNQKFVKVSGGYLSYVPIEMLPKTQWQWASGSPSLWDILENL